MTSNHFSDENACPAGGSTYGRGFAIAWQNGPLGLGQARKEPNGAFVEDIIEAARDRLTYYQRSKFHSEYNRSAILHLTNALMSLRARTNDRFTRNVEGTHEV